MLSATEQIQQGCLKLGAASRSLIDISNGTHDQVGRRLDSWKQLEQVQETLGMDDPLTHGRVAGSKE